jgi:hypothetical protein
MKIGSIFIQENNLSAYFLLINYTCLALYKKVILNNIINVFYK